MASSSEMVRNKRQLPIEANDEPSPSRARNDDYEQNEENIYEVPAKTQKLISKFKRRNKNRMKPQIFDLPKPIINYILKTVNGKVMKKLYRTCKYFFYINPYCIVDEISYGVISFNGKSYQTANFPSNIWALNELKIQWPYGMNFLEKIARCEVENILMGDEFLTSKMFNILTESKKVKSWQSGKIIIENEGPLSFEKLLESLPNSETIIATVQSIPKNIPPRKKIIKILHLEIEDNSFNTKEYYKFFKKILAPKASVKLTFRYPNEESALLGLKQFSKFSKILDKKWKPSAQKPNAKFFCL